MRNADSLVSMYITFAHNFSAWQIESRRQNIPKAFDSEVQIR